MTESLPLETVQLGTDVALALETGVALQSFALPDGTALAAQHARIASALEAHPTATELAQLKDDIVALFREASAAASAYATFKSTVKSLAEQWKQIDGRPSTILAGGGARNIGTSRVDHLGASTYVEKGWSRLSLGDASGAAVALHRALELSPGNSEAESLLGWAQMLQEQYDTALLTFHNVLLRDPHYTLARTNVGYICLRKKMYGEAIEHLSRAIRLNNDRKATLYAHLYLGMVYREREMYDDAELFFHKALELGPNLLQAWYEMGRARWFAGDRNGAMNAWRHGANANKFNPWGKRCAEMVEQVEAGAAPPRVD